MKPPQRFAIFLVLFAIFTSCKKDKDYVYIAPPAPPLALAAPTIFVAKYIGLPWDSTATGLMFIESPPGLKLSAAPENHVIKVKVELVQQGANTVLPFVIFGEIGITTYPIFYTIKPDPPDGSGEMMPGPFSIFERQISGIDFTKKVDVTINSQL